MCAWLVLVGLALPGLGRNVRFEAFFSIWKALSLQQLRRGLALQYTLILLSLGRVIDVPLVSPLISSVRKSCAKNGQNGQNPPFGRKTHFLDVQLEGN